MEKDALRIKRNKKIIISVIAVLLLAVIIAGAVIGTVAIVRNIRAVVRYEGITLDKGMVCYLAATYKTGFMREWGISPDDEQKWNNTVSDRDITYSELYLEGLEKYIRGVVIGAYLFDRYHSISNDEQRSIERACEEILEYSSGGDKKRFNEDTRAMGFDYKDMCRAVEILYKSERAKAVIYGEAGKALELDGGRLDECLEYYKQYSRVKILYIPIRLDIERDDNGKLSVDKNGKYVTREFTSAEISEREAEINEIRRLIEATITGGNEKMTEVYFDTLQDKYNYNTTFTSTGYYFASDSEYRKNFAKDSSSRLTGEYRSVFYNNREAVISAAFDMQIGEYRELADEYGVTFIYKCEREDMAYGAVALADMFHDFYSDAANYLYALMTDAILDDVKVRDKYYDIDFLSLPYNYVYVPKIGV